MGPLRVIGRYALYNEIAAGGMATVHIGRLLGPVGFARTVAIKRLHPQFAKDPEFASMFLDEARVAARVQHPNVVATIDVVATDGELFLIMDYVRGESLSKLVRAAKKNGDLVPPRIAAAIICGFLHGLHAAHEAKNERGEPLHLVHRDVSPQNVLVGADGIARVLDFGVAKATGRIQVTKDGQIKGKLAYMPPEQVTARELSRAVDVYASAIVMWETLVGERLFKGDSEADTLSKILQEPVRAPSAVDRRVPSVFDAPILRALSREPAHRHPTAKQFALELEQCVGIASPTEVGEWVERIAGPVLSAREAQIAQIESDSATVRPAPDYLTDSDISSLPVRLAPNAGATHRPPTVLQRNLDETISASAPMSLPVDRKWAVYAMIGGMLVLLGIVGWIVAGKGMSAASPSAAESASPSASASATATATATASATATATATASATATATATASATATAAATATATATAAASTLAAPPSPPRAPLPSKPPLAAPSAPTKKACDPPYTVDASGHKKYKLECL